MERAELKLLAAGLLVGIAAGFLAARALYVGNGAPSQRGPMVFGPAAPGGAASPEMGSAPGEPELAQEEMSQEQQAIHDEINELLARVRKQPEDRPANLRLADITFDNGLYDIAAKFYEAALRIDGNDARALTDLGISYRHMNRHDEALQVLERAVTVDPGHSTAWFDLAVVRFQDRKDLAGAREAVDKVLALDADFPEAARLRDSIAAAS